MPKEYGTTKELKQRILVLIAAVAAINLLGFAITALLRSGGS